MNERSLSLGTPRSTVRRTIGILCVLLFFGALTALAVWSGGFLTRSSDYVVRFNQATGLTKSSPVTLLGQSVGRVRTVRITEHSGQPEIEARFSIAAEHAPWVRDGTRVVVRSSLLGSPWLDLLPGPTGGATLATGAVLPAEIERGKIDELLELQPVVQNLINHVSELVVSLNATVQRIDPVLAKLEGQLDTTRQGLEQIGLLLGDVRGMFAQVQADETKIVGDLTVMLKQVNEELLPGIEKALRETTTAMTDTVSAFDGTIGILDSKLPVLLDQTEQAMKNTRDLTEAAANIWPFSSYWKRKKKEEERAARAAGGQ